MISHAQFEGRVFTDLLVEIADLCNWLDNHALPLWFETGFDHDLGIFHERLDLNGNPVLGLPRRLLVQCRQISVYAYATLRGRLNAKNKIISTYERLRHLYQVKGSPGQWLYSIHADGKPADTSVDSYTLAFVIFTLAWLYRLEPLERYLDDADHIFDVLDGPLSTQGGGVKVSRNQREDILLQNPVMHLFEACLMLYEAAGRKRDFNRANTLANFFEKKLFNRYFRAIPEQYSIGWNIYSPSVNWFEPGHHFEWSWLLRQYERLGGSDYSSLISQLSDRALGEGLDPSHNVIEQVGLQKDFRMRSSRNWGICEFIKFSSIEYQESMWRKDYISANLWMNRSFESIKTLKHVFLNTNIKGTWRDKVDEDGNPITDFIPASSFYHIGFAIAEAERVFTRVVPQKLKYELNRRPALFLDRDGVINIDVDYAHKPEQIKFVDGIFELVRSANTQGFKVIVVTNQSGVGRSYFTERDVISLHFWIADRFMIEGAKIDCFYHCPYFDNANLEVYRRANHFDRKPFPGMLKRALLEWNIDFNSSNLIGDKFSDMEAAEAVGVKSILANSNMSQIIDF